MPLQLFRDTGKRIIFSDIDGTLVHLADDLRDLGVISEDGRSFTPFGGAAPIAIRALPPSSTGLQGYISERTLQLVAALRRAGHVFVLISGARSSTVLERLPYLPSAEAYVMENGGRIFFGEKNSPALTAAPMVEDMTWRTMQAAAGPAFQIATPASDREGALWDLFRKMEKDGWACDTRSYSTEFRVNLGKSKKKSEADLRKIIAGLPPELACSFNLGSADFYPATSGKDMAARYLLDKFGVPAKLSVSMGDDDNDLALAALVHHTYIPGFSADTVRDAVAADPSSFTVAATPGFAGTEEVLERMLRQDFGFGAQSMLYSYGTLLSTMLAFAALGYLRRTRR